MTKSVDFLPIARDDTQEQLDLGSVLCHPDAKRTAAPHAFTTTSSAHAVVCVFRLKQGGKRSKGSGRRLVHRSFAGVAAGCCCRVAVAKEPVLAGEGVGTKEEPVVLLLSLASRHTATPYVCDMWL
ncbi:hypothetical protein E3N88_15538 [Mikania micrantha]|uniref:Uncharacterized protein n=1 Tax=Mikania micrantha TaxID=192012 RepID=A0A5N6NX45_9ASTR|nr:hypothetical protein E3N88_15538 [Mikania micrantha]